MARVCSSSAEDFVCRAIAPCWVCSRMRMDAERRFRCVESMVDVVFVRLIRAVARS